MGVEFKLFYTFFALLLVTFSSLIFQPQETSSLNKIQKITEVTKLPGIALSTEPFEERIPYYRDSSNRFYLNTNSYGYMEFVYAH